MLRYRYYHQGSLDQLFATQKQLMLVLDSNTPHFIYKMVFYHMTNTVISI